MSTKTELTEKVSSVTLRIPVSLKLALQTLARRQHRSLNAQCVHLLEGCVQERQQCDADAECYTAQATYYDAHSRHAEQ